MSDWLEAYRNAVYVALIALAWLADKLYEWIKERVRRR